MLMVVALKALVIWVGILALAIANGVLRESILIPVFGTPTALVLSGLLLSALIFCVAYFSLPWLHISRPILLYIVGVGWLVLTLFLSFRSAFGKASRCPSCLRPTHLKVATSGLSFLQQRSLHHTSLLS